MSSNRKRIGIKDNYQLGYSLVPERHIQVIISSKMASRGMLLRACAEVQLSKSNAMKSRTATELPSMTGRQY